MALLYGRAGRLKAKNGGFRPGQWTTWTFGVGAAVTGGKQPGGAVYATRTLPGTARPVTGVIASRLHSESGQIAPGHTHSKVNFTGLTHIP